MFVDDDVTRPLPPAYDLARSSVLVTTFRYTATVVSDIIRHVIKIMAWH